MLCPTRNFLNIVYFLGDSLMLKINKILILIVIVIAASSCDLGSKKKNDHEEKNIHIDSRAEDISPGNPVPFKPVHAEPSQIR